MDFVRTPLTSLSSPPACALPRQVAISALGPSEMARFKELCSRAFLILRNHAHDLLNLIALMVPARLPELSALPDIEYMRHMFKLHLTEAECAAWWMRTLDKYAHVLFC